MNLIDLPVNAALPQLRDALSAQGAAVLIAPPGAGKTTAVPLALLGEDWLKDQKIIMLEPRRLAARTAARRMANSLGEEVGQTIGYRMRLDTKVSAATRIEIVTEGVFQRMICDDPELAGVACVIFDEFHERSLDADFGLALALDVRAALRDDLRVLVMSATLDGARVSKLMGDAPLVESQGRMFPVEMRYAPRRADQRIEEAMAAAIRKALIEDEGSILAFLPGQAEIRRVAERLDGKLPANAFVAPLFGAMDIRDQDMAVQPAPNGKRKIVLATALAETSITIDGVRIVIDSGLARLPQFEPALGISRLETKRASRASITQRAGRAGRTAPGIAIRLWQEEQTATLPAFEAPEICQADLSSFLLNCRSWGVQGPDALALLDQPPIAHVKEAEKLLTQLGALDEAGHLTPIGKSLANIGLEPRLAAMVLAGRNEADCTARAFLAMLIGERGLGGNGVDLSTRFERAWRDKTPRAKQLRSLAERVANSAGVKKNAIAAKQKSDLADVGQMLCAAYPDRVAMRRSQSSADYIMVNGRGVSLDETDPLAAHKYIIVTDMIGAAKSARIMAAAPLSEDEITVNFGDKIEDIDQFNFDPKTAKLTRRLSRKLGAIALTTTTAPIEPSAQTTAALVSAIGQYGLSILPWSKEIKSQLGRLQWLSKTLGADWPDFSDEALLKTVDEWLEPFLAGKTALTQLSATDLSNALMSRLPYELQRTIGALAPTHFTAPTGSHIPLTYGAEGEAPVLSIRVQELFGLATHPAIGGGKIPLTIELLSPAHRPIQITKDLPSFWQGSWSDVRADMRGRYPRHEWPIDPAVAQPTRRAKPRK